MRRSQLIGVAVVLAVGGCSCDSPVAPTESMGNVVTITSAGASPLTIQISVGERVQFVNNDSVAHEMSSDMHPSHLECPAIKRRRFSVAGSEQGDRQLRGPGDLHVS